MPSSCRKQVIRAPILGKQLQNSFPCSRKLAKVATEKETAQLKKSLKSIFGFFDEGTLFLSRASLRFFESVGSSQIQTKLNQSQIQLLSKLIGICR